MCGIIGVTGDAAPFDLVLSGLEALEYRGYDSAGIAIVDTSTDSIFRVRAAEQPGSIRALGKSADEAPSSCGAAIGHTRWATHGPPTQENAHPHLDCTRRVAIIHNGIIENHRELSEGLVAAGHVLTSKTDSEVIAHLIEDEIAAGKDLHGALCAVVKRLTGDFAIAVVAASDPNVIAAARRTSPLILGVTDRAGLIGSDIAALLTSTRELYQLGDDEIAEIRPGSLRVTDTGGNERRLVPISVTWSIEDAQRGGFADFMSKEIDEQPRAVRETLFGRLSPMGSTDIEELDISKDELARFKRVYLIACGSSYHAALVGRQALEHLAEVPAEADIASEFRYRDSVLGPDVLVVAISQSGETIDTLHAMREAKARGARVVAMTNVVDSLMTREADGVLYTHAGPEIGVASTKCHLSQLAMSVAFALHMADARGSLSHTELASWAKVVHSLPDLIQQTIDQESHYREVADRFTDVEDFYFLGRRSGLPVALEGALKLKELAYVRAEAYPAGEMKHGPISLIEKGAVVVVVATRTRLFEKVMANVEEMRARGATIVGVIEEGDDEAAALLDAALRVPRVDEICSPIIDVIPLQFFAHEIARNRGNDVDRPRNLAKVVTVE